jgi:hypothetical protein
MIMHRHKGLNGKWITLVDGPHTHSEILTALASSEEKVYGELVTINQRIEAAETRIAALETTPPPDPSPTPPVNLQEAINDTHEGDTLDCGDGSYTGTFTIPKTIVFRNVSIAGSTAHGSYVLSVTGNEALVENVRIDGGYIAIGLKNCAKAEIHSCRLTGLVYAGIMGLSAIDCVISDNEVNGVRPVDDSDNWNAYGIAISNLSGQPNSSGCLVECNLISRIPTWHGLDTHGGIDCIFRKNNIFAVRRAIFLTLSPTNVLCDGNDLTAPTPAEQADIPEGCPIAYGTDYRGISVAGGTGAISNNVGHNYASSRWWNPISGASGYTFSWNIPSIP